MNLGYERYRKKPFFTIINFNQYKSKLSIVIHNRHKMWREEVAFDNKFITKKSLKLHLKLSWLKLYTIPPKTAIYSSGYLQSMKRHLQATILKCHLGLNTRLKRSSLDFPFSWLLFVIGFNNKIIQFLFLIFMFH